MPGANAWHAQVIESDVVIIIRLGFRISECILLQKLMAYSEKILFYLIGIGSWGIRTPGTVTRTAV